MVNESTEDFALKFKKNYVNTYLPSWMALEIVTFTHLSKLYSNLRDSSAKSEIAKFYGLQTPVLENWLLILTYTRNTCAHHSRFWNRNLSYKASKFKKELPYNWINTNGVSKNSSYMYLCIIKYLLDRINPSNTFKDRLVDLFNKYDNIDKYKAMSFTEDWEDQPLWRTEILNVNGMKEKEKQTDKDRLKIKGTLDDVLKASVPKSKEDKKDGK